MSKPPRPLRSDYRHMSAITPRWRDNDVYAHVNNAVFFEYVDTAVNGWIIEYGGLAVPHGPVVGLVVHSECQFFAALRFPRPVHTGLRVDRLGSSSVTYGVGLFDGDAEEAAAAAAFTHVYVDAQTHRPVPIPDMFRHALEGLRIG
ncbi:acyl-CoA thioester hydrolase [Rubricella aquisinus]|uniref:Acyl-CoA thioester hydrolase n=1 Tax=Rubricella aquisinus TaxID=2028108 RepID=A0A840WWI4_9RHOB|nr:thioesterase family protein [Rubricella aquisinus]MBB5515540.1 acyl-CoA thioester hydrolase [Rubricella aquisinus]